MRQGFLGQHGQEPAWQSCVPQTVRAGVGKGALRFSWQQPGGENPKIKLAALPYAGGRASVRSVNADENWARLNGDGACASGSPQQAGSGATAGWCHLRTAWLQPQGCRLPSGLADEEM